MANRVKPIPEGHRTVAPYLAIKNAVGALEFYKRTFGAIETYKLVVPDGRVGHAEIRPGECRSAIGARGAAHQHIAADRRARSVVAKRKTFAFTRRSLETR